MALPAAYTESTLSALMEAELGPLAVSLGLDEGDALPEAVNEVIGLLGHALSEETTTAGLMKVRALARWQAWLAAEAAATEAVDLKAGSVGLTRSQLFDHIRLRLARAEAAALAYPEAQAAIAGGGVAVVGATTTAGSPYGWAAYPEFGA
jgi:hypothetical protein